jgi:pimeloyl-ACP methyl ester carboxylesterase
MTRRALLNEDRRVVVNDVPGADRAGAVLPHALSIATHPATAAMPTRTVDHVRADEPDQLYLPFGTRRGEPGRAGCAHASCAVLHRASGGVSVMGAPSASPRRDQVLTLRDGRRLGYAEWGSLDGRPVVLLHGMPGSRLLCPDVEQTERFGVRLLTLDRPGYGMSTPRPGRTLLDWADEFVEWAEIIGLPPCPIVGWSSGGPYALACAVRCPERVTSIGLASSVAPLDEVPGAWNRQPAEVRDLTELVRTDLAAARDGVRARCQWFERGWQTMVEPAGSNPDDVLLSQRAVFEPMRELMREAARQGIAGYVDDWIAESLPWQFSPRRVHHDVHVWWGDADELVPRADAEALASTIARSTLTVLPGEGHLLLITRWAEVLTALH